MLDLQSSEGLDKFPEETRIAVNGLAWLGHLEDSFEFCGHRFVLRTLKGEEELAAGMVTKEYVETLGQARAWAWANVALALHEVDGDSNFCPPLGPDLLAHARARFRFCTSKWYWPLAEYLFGRLAALNERQVAALEAMRDLSTGGPSTPSPSPASLTDLGISPEDLATEEQSTPSA